jgi:hypothetical protein
MSTLSPREMFLLDLACTPLAEAFDATPYLVGTTMQPRGDRAPRDVDVRLMLEDDHYDRLAATGVSLAFLGLAIGQYVASLTGLPIDFQLQRRTEANALHPGARNPLGRRTLDRFEGDCPVHPDGTD